MGCPNCEIHAVIYGVTKKSASIPQDNVIPTSSKKVTQSQASQDHKDKGSQENPKTALVQQQ